MRVTDSVALVTGGASGLGLATARRLVDQGASVVLLDLPSSPGEKAAAELGERAVFAPGDVTAEGDVASALDTASGLGELRVLVNCAGVGTPGRVLGKNGPLPLAEFTRVVTVNLIGTFNVVRLATERMAVNEPRDGDRGGVHGVGCRVRRADRPGGLLCVQGRRGRDDAAPRP